MQTTTETSVTIAIRARFDSIRFEVHVRLLGPDWLQHHSRMETIEHVHSFSNALHFMWLQHFAAIQMNSWYVVLFYAT